MHDPFVRVIDYHGLVHIHRVEPDVLADDEADAPVSKLFHQTPAHECMIASPSYGVRLADVMEKGRPVHELHVDRESCIEK